MSGPIGSRVLRSVTIPASWLYRAVVSSRNRSFERGTRKIQRLPSPVVSVGNLTVGGSGKTPVVALVARCLLSKAQRVAVLSRGYRGRRSVRCLLVSDGRRILASPVRAGDEPVELAQSVPGLVVAVGESRFLSGLEVHCALGPHLFLLDDGFQHRQLFRDLDVVCIDSSESVESLRLLPAGRLREPIRSLNRAGAIVWTRWKQGRPSDALASRVLASLDSKIPIFRSRQVPEGFARLGGVAERLDATAFQGLRVGIFAAIARPERVREDLEALGAEVTWFVSRRDHYAWRPGTVVDLLRKARERGVAAVVTTWKDAVKLEVTSDLPVPLYRMESRAEVLEKDDFENLLASALPLG